MSQKIEQQVLLITSGMNTYIYDYQRSAAHIAAIAVDGKFPSVFESDVFTETLNRAKGATEVARIIASGVDNQLALKLKNSLLHHLMSKTVVNSQFLLPIQEAILILEN